MSTLPARMQYIDRYIGDLRQKTGYYVGYISSDEELYKPNFYSLLENDLEVRRCLNLLSTDISCLIPKFITNNKLLENILIELFNYIINYQEGIKGIIEKSVLYGLGLAKKSYSQKIIYACNNPRIKWNIIEEIKEVDKRRLRLERSQDNKTDVYWTIWSPVHDKYIILEDRNYNIKASYAIQDYIWLVHSYEETYPYFRGIGDSLYPLVYTKDKVIQYWCDYCETRSKPYTIVKTNLLKGALDAKAGEGFMNIEDRKNTILDNFEKNFARHILVLDKTGDEVDFHESTGASVNVMHDLANYVDEKIRNILLGSKLNSGVQKNEGSGGSYALGKLHENDSDKIINYLAKKLANALTRDFLYEIIDKNRFNFKILGITDEDLDLVHLEFLRQE
jgi:hypothetical protein